MKALNKMVDPTKQRQNGAGDDDGLEQRKRCASRMDIRDLVTFAPMSVKHSVLHRPKIGQHVKADKERTEPRK